MPLQKLFDLPKQYALVCGVILLIGILAASLLLPKDKFQQTKEAIAQNPGNLENYLSLADQLIDNGQFEEAEKILQDASRRYVEAGSPRPNDQVLGANDDRLQALQQKKLALDPQEIQKQIDRWEQILADKPDYRDGYLQLAKLYWQIFNEDLAKTNLQKALDLDPNYPPALELQKTIL